VHPFPADGRQNAFLGPVHEIQLIVRWHEWPEQRLELEGKWLDHERVWVRLLVCLYSDGDIPKSYYKRDWAVELIEKARTEGRDSKSHMVLQVVKMFEIMKLRR
jgi:hypothetical protein